MKMDLLKGYHGLLVLLLTSATAKCELYPTEMVPGIYMEEIENPIFYESFIPIIYEYNYPNWSLMDVTLRDWRGMCTSDDFSPSYTCPVFFYLERFIERMQNEIVRQTTKNFARQVHTSLHGTEEMCTRIQAHFHSLITKKSSIDDYLQKLKTCPLQGQEIHRSINDYVYNIKGIYQNMVSKFEREFSSKVGTLGVTDRFGPAYYVNQITAAQGLMMFNYWVEHTRWETAAHNCIQQMIPTSIIKPSNLTDSLRKVELEATKQRYVLSIPTTEAGVYLNTPLADCTYTDASTFLVRILVPVRRKSISPKLYRIQSVPFLLNDNNDKLLACELSGGAGRYIYDEISGFLASADNCGSENLCQIDEPSRMSLPTLCAAAYFSKNNENIKKYCDFVCQDIIDGLYPPIPIFTRVRSDTIVVTGNNNIELMVKCEGKRDEIVNPDRLGSLEITLPCNCSLHFRSQVFVPEQKCGTELQIRVILPVHFFNDEFLRTGANFTGNLTADIMETKYIRVNTGREADSVMSVQEDVETGQEQTFELLNKAMAGNFKHNSGEESSSSSSSSAAVSWLWVLFIIQTICVFACLFFILRHLDFAPWATLRNAGSTSGLSFSNPACSTVSTENIAERANNKPSHEYEPYPV